MLYDFSDCSGLRAKFDKTEAIWIGAKRGCVETIKTIKNIRRSAIFHHLPKL
jgi:hypothetical protein